MCKAGRGRAGVQPAGPQAPRSTWILPAPPGPHSHPAPAGPVTGASGSPRTWKGQGKERDRQGQASGSCRTAGGRCDSRRGCKTHPGCSFYEPLMRKSAKGEHLCLTTKPLDTELGAYQVCSQETPSQRCGVKGHSVPPPARCPSPLRTQPVIYMCVCVSTQTCTWPPLAPAGEGCQDPPCSHP